MKCPDCQAAYPEGSTFCSNCGRRLKISCPYCGAQLPPEACFCSNCGRPQTRVHSSPASAGSPAVGWTGPHRMENTLQQFIPKELLEKLESAKNNGAMHGKRRIVTMLFSDVKDSTQAASQLDPEDWAEVINHTFEHMIRPVYRYEGIVARLMGDGLLAFFGAPIAHEDDPQRAVLAGLEIVKAVHNFQPEIAQRWGIALDIRVGINTGLVVVGAVGSDLRMEYTALGDAINLAARMEQNAQPGTVLVAEPTYKLIAPLFEVDQLVELQVKGKPEPIRAYAILGLKKKPGSVRGISGLDAPLTGRDFEMKQLEEAIENLCRGHGGIFAVMGEAGLGKSRLLAELRKSVAVDSRDLLWLEGRSRSFENSTPYAPFIDLLSNLLNLQNDGTNDQKYTHLKEQLASLVPGSTDHGAPFIATLLGISLSGEDLDQVKYLEPPSLRGRIFASFKDLLASLSATQPLVLFFDDLHWIDPTSFDLLEACLPMTEDFSILTITAFRPRADELSWRFKEQAAKAHPKNFTMLNLEPLNENASLALFGSLLHIDDLPERVRHLVLSRAEGNPFYVEELIRSLIDEGFVVQENDRWRATQAIENITIPNTLIGVITARLDRLNESDRQTAQAASVIGREFSHVVLADISSNPETLGSNLASLQKRELIRERIPHPQQTFTFKHVLTQEAAYSSIFLSERRELHERVAESLEKRQPERIGDIARHFLEARQPGRALPYLVKSGEAAARSYANPEAIGFFTRALELREATTDLPLIRQAYEGLGSVLTLANQIPAALQNYQDILILAEREGDLPMQVSALNKQAGLQALKMGHFQEAEVTLAKAEQLARKYDVKTGIPEMAVIRCQMCMAAADFDGIVRHMREVVEIGEALEHNEYLSMGLEHVAGSLMFLTRFDESWEKAHEALQVAQKIGDREHEAALLTSTIPYIQVTRGQLDEAQQTGEAGLMIAERIGSVLSLVYGNWLLADIARLRGEYDLALLHGQRSLEASLPVEEFMPFMTVQPLGPLGLVYLEISSHYLDEVARFHQHALRLLENPPGMSGGGTAWADLVFCALALGDLETAEASFVKGLEIPTMFMLVERPRYLLGMAQLAFQRNQFMQGLQYAAEARAYSQERKMMHVQPLIALTTGKIKSAAGETEAALDELGRAERLASELNLRPIVWQAHAEAARLLTAQGQAAEAETHRVSAKNMIEEIAELFNDTELRNNFLTHTLAKID